MLLLYFFLLFLPSPHALFKLQPNLSLSHLASSSPSECCNGEKGRASSTAARGWAGEKRLCRAHVSTLENKFHSSRCCCSQPSPALHTDLVWKQAALSSVPQLQRCACSRGGETEARGRGKAEELLLAPVGPAERCKHPCMPHTQTFLCTTSIPMCCKHSRML